MKTHHAPAFAAVIGIDWADRKHDICLRDSATNSMVFSVLEHSPAAIDAWANALRARFQEQPIAVCLEQRKGPLIYALMKYACFVLFPINPQTVARYRRAFTPSRAKDDPSDAAILLELFDRHRDKLRPWQPGSTDLRALQQLVEMRRRLVADKVRCTNRLTATLKNYYPHPLEWFTDKDTDIFCDFLARWPTLQATRRAHKATLLSFFADHNARYPEVNAKRVALIKAAMPLTVDNGVIVPCQLLVQSLVAQLKVILTGLRAFDAEIKTRFVQHDDAAVFASLPGAGAQFAPRLLAAFGEDRERYGSADDILKYSGIAPVTERSGQKSWVHWRYSCPKFLRQTFVEWARETIRHSFWARAFYQQQRQNGKSHQMAIRSLAFKWIRILFRCWKDRKPYDEAKYLMALKDKGSPLLNFAAS